MRLKTDSPPAGPRASLISLSWALGLCLVASPSLAANPGPNLGSGWNPLPGGTMAAPFLQSFAGFAEVDAAAGGPGLRLSAQDAASKQLSFVQQLRSEIGLGAWESANLTPVAEVSEPDPTAMMLAGVGMMVFVARRRSMARE
jgi:hypothetical protein